MHCLITTTCQKTSNQIVNVSYVLARVRNRVITCILDIPQRCDTNWTLNIDTSLIVLVFIDTHTVIKSKLYSPFIRSETIPQVMSTCLVSNSDVLKIV